MQPDNVHNDFVHNCIEEIGFGKFQILVMAMAFTKTFTFASTTSVVAIIQPFLRCKLNVGTFEASWIITAGLLAAIFSSPCVGRISDLYGRKRTMFLFFSIHVIVAILNSLSSSLTMIVITRTAIGVFLSCRGPILSYAMEVFPVSKRKYIGGMKLFVSLGAIFGLSAGMVSLGYLSWRWFIVIAEVTPSTIASFLSLFFLNLHAF